MCLFFCLRTCVYALWGKSQEAHFFMKKYGIFFDKWYWIALKNSMRPIVWGKEHIDAYVSMFVIAHLNLLFFILIYFLLLLFLYMCFVCVRVCVCVSVPQCSCGGERTTSFLETILYSFSATTWRVCTNWVDVRSTNLLVYSSWDEKSEMGLLWLKSSI